MKTQKVCFEYLNRILVSESVPEVINWINSLPGLTCNSQTQNNIEIILNSEWKRWGYSNQNISPVNKDGFRLEYLKTTGIRTGKINFTLTDCNSVEEILAERAAFIARVDAVKEKVAKIQSTLGNKLSELLNRKSKSCVKLLHHSGLYFTLQIGQEGYWVNYSGSSYWHYLSEYFTHFDGETLITDEDKNVIDILNKFINEQN